MNMTTHTTFAAPYWLLTLALLAISPKDAAVAQKSGAGFSLPTMRAVVIGISNYNDASIPDLNYAHRDAAVFARALERVQDVHLDTVVLLTEARANYGNIHTTMEWITRKSKPGDIIVFFFSGHGGNEMKAGREKGYLLVHDTPRTNFNQFAFAHSELGEYLEAWVGNNIRVYLIADACHAGKIAGNKGGIPGKQLANNNLVLLAGNTENLMEVLSCKGDEESIERSDLAGGQGVFTYFLLKGMMGEADRLPRDSKLKNLEIKRYLYDSVQVCAKPDLQHPHITGDEDQDFLNFRPDPRFFQPAAKPVKKPLGKSTDDAGAVFPKSPQNAVQPAGPVTDGATNADGPAVMVSDSAFSLDQSKGLDALKSTILTENNRILQQYMNQDFIPWTTKLEDIQQGIQINQILTGIQRGGSAAYKKSYANLFFFKALAWYEYSKYGDPDTRTERLTAAQESILKAKSIAENAAFVQLLSTQISSALGFFPEYATRTPNEAVRSAFDVTQQCAPGWRLSYMLDGAPASWSTYDSLATEYALQNSVSWYATDARLPTDRWRDQVKHNPVLAEDLLYTYALRYDPVASSDNQAVISFGMAANLGSVKRQLTDARFKPDTEPFFVPGLYYTTPVRNAAAADQLHLFSQLDSWQPLDGLPGFDDMQYTVNSGDFSPALAEQLNQLLRYGHILNNTDNGYATIVRDIYDASTYSPGILMNGGSDDPAGAQLVKATEAYTKNQLKEALHLLQNLSETGNTEALKLRAHARFRLQQYDQAAVDFESLTKRLSYRSDAEWYLLLCHAARLPKTRTAYETLLAKVAVSGHPFEMKALALKDKLARK